MGGKVSIWRYAHPFVLSVVSGGEALQCISPETAGFKNPVRPEPVEG